MKNLIINNLRYRIEANNNLIYGADIPFKPGLNIIWGPNSLGKTSIITGIIYGLGLEKSLGIFKLNQNPFKPEFYSKIEGNNIIKSYLFLEISNGEKTITIFRHLKGEKTNIVAVKDCTISEYSNVERFEKYIIEGDGVFTESGFQNYIFDFLGLPILEVPSYDGDNVKIYFENLAPLFFVEQRAGWSQIQARQITRYNIRDVKSVVFEYLMGFDKFDLHLIELERKKIEELIKKRKEKLASKEENIFIISNGEADGKELIITDKSSGKYDINEYIKLLRRKYSIKSIQNKTLTESKEQTQNNENGLRENLKIIDYQYRRSIDKSNNLHQEIRGYENYIERIQSNKFKNKQLKKIEELSLDLNIGTCPICEQPLVGVSDEECILCHTTTKNRISTPSQNLNFLEDEEKSFKNVLRSKQLEYRKELQISQDLKDKIKTTEKLLEHQTDTFTGKILTNYRNNVIELDNIFKNIEKFERIKERWDELNVLRDEILENVGQSTQLKSKIDSYSNSDSDSKILSSIKNHFKNNVRELGLFKAKEELINKIKIDSTDNYSPYLDSFDIYNISSSSDNVRIILSYYMALLQTSISLKEKTKIKFPNILILDEPKQQNLDNKSLISCIKLFEEIPQTNSQVILTTYSENKQDRTKFLKYFCYEMKHDKDYLLKRIISKSK